MIMTATRTMTYRMVTPTDLRAVYLRSLQRRDARAAQRERDIVRARDRREKARIITADVVMG